jgi:ATP synthase I chain
LTRKSAEENFPTPPFNREIKKVRAIEKRTMQILLLALVVSLFWQKWNFSLGLLLGGLVALLNFRWLGLIGRKIFLERNPLHGAQIPIKFLAVILAVFLILNYTPIHAVAFLLGTFTLVLGILYETLRPGFRE